MSQTMSQKMQNIEAVFFDLDGTLMDTASDFINVMHQMQTLDQKPLIDPEIIYKHVSEGSRKMVELAYQLAPGTQELEEKRNIFLDCYDRHIKRVDRASPAMLYPGISKLLKNLEEKNIVWGVITNKPADYASLLIEQNGLKERSQTLICPDHVSRNKPDPESLLLACQQTGTSPENCLYVGDHFRDIEAGRAAGMTTIAALYGYITDDDNPASWQADHYINQASEILPLLESMEWQLPRRNPDV
ncbi:phosphoglycolate phosphatase [Endozoicomonas sp. OPT23]|uniref:HAD family hydrolase n=1 Tax=Endozoicomonas sp. OPT23 TaxID=2072845 RepID=UPI00129A62A6|nr:HAD-IA family hydrolase [Endozoicomonas sp. OPT23]MRI34494.1 phosphoglycolate phosphatase [Endozoicomonas sp. OPT23]